MRVITGTARGTQLKAPKGLATRPTMDQVKEGLFSAIQFEIEGRRVLDLFAGSGQLGIEALSRGACHATFVDKSKQAINVIQENLKKTNFTDRADVLLSDFHFVLCNSHQKYDIIFLDPPYLENFLENALKCISEIDILSDGGIIICERPSEKRLSEDFDRIWQHKTYKYGKTSISIYRKV